MNLKPARFVLIIGFAAMLSACDRSPQAADGATASGDPGVAPAAGGGKVADIAEPDNTAAVAPTAPHTSNNPEKAAAVGSGGTAGTGAPR